MGWRARAGLIAAAVVIAAVARDANAAILGLQPGQLLLMDSNASAGNGRLFDVNRTSHIASPLGSGFGLEPWSIVAPTSSYIYAADATGECVWRYDVAASAWNVLTSGNLLDYPSAAMVAESPQSLLVACGGGRVVRVDTATGQQSLYANYGSLAANPWGMVRLSDGTLIIGDSFGKLIRIAPNGTASVLSSGGLLHSISGIVDLEDDTVAVSDDVSFTQHSLVRVSVVDGSQSPLTPSGSFSKALNGMTVDGNGNILAAAAQTGSAGVIYQVRISDGAITTYSSDLQLANPAGILIFVPEPAGAITVLSLCAVTAIRRRRRR